MPNISTSPTADIKAVAWVHVQMVMDVTTSTDASAVVQVDLHAYNHKWNFECTHNFHKSLYITETPRYSLFNTMSTV